MKIGSTLTYLHGDHLGSTVMETNNLGAVATDEKYFAFGKQRDSGKVTTDHRFTGQKEDASGLQYFNARFYDPVIGMFVSPDTIVPQPGLASDYNRYAYVHGRVMNAIDPSGHCALGKNAQGPDDKAANYEGGDSQCWSIYYSLVSQGIEGLMWQWSYSLGDTVAKWASDHHAAGLGATVPIFGGIMGGPTGNTLLVGYTLLTAGEQVILINGSPTYYVSVDPGVEPLLVQGSSGALMGDSITHCQDICMPSPLSWILSLIYPSARQNKLVPATEDNLWAMARFNNLVGSYKQSHASALSGAVYMNMAWSTTGILAAWPAPSFLTGAAKSGDLLQMGMALRNDLGTTQTIRSFGIEASGSGVNFGSVVSKFYDLPSH